MNPRYRIREHSPGEQRDNVPPLVDHIERQEVDMKVGWFKEPLSVVEPMPANDIQQHEEVSLVGISDVALCMNFKPEGRKQPMIRSSMTMPYERAAGIYASVEVGVGYGSARLTIDILSQVTWETKAAFRFSAISRR